MTRPTHCRDCHRTLVPKRHQGVIPDGSARHHGRGLCPKCHLRRRRDGTLTDADRVTRSRDEMLTEWELLRSEGYTPPQAERRLGLARGSLVTALRRARRSGVAA